jgi:hypothetical protein
MQKHVLDGNVETEDAGFSARRLSAFSEPGATQADQKLRIVVPPMPPRELCLGDRKSLAALRAAEFVLWQASGGDFLSSARAAEFIELAQQL